MNTETADARAALDRLAMGANYAHDVRLIRASLDRLDSLSSPPADDVREALAEAMYKATTKRDDWNPMRGVSNDYAAHLRDSFLAEAQKIIDAGFKVRLRGTVTDAEVEAAWRTYEGIPSETFVMGHWIGKARKRMRAALEAARGARVSAENPTPTNHTIRSNHG